MDIIGGLRNMLGAESEASDGGDSPDSTDEHFHGLERLEPRVLLSVGGVEGVWDSQGPSPIDTRGPKALGWKEAVGAVQDVAVNPDDPNTVYVGSVNGGVWKTENARDSSPTWKPLTDDLPSLSVGALEFDPTDSNNKTLVMGVGVTSSFRDGGDFTGVWRTTDGGSEWEHVSVPKVDNENITSVAARGNTLLAASDNVVGGGQGNGLFRGTKSASGWSWTRISDKKSGPSSGLPAGPVTDLVGHPDRQDVFYAGVRGDNAGLFRSEDTGETWNPVDSGPLDGEIAQVNDQSDDEVTRRIEIAIHDQTSHSDSSSDAIYAGVLNDPDGADGDDPTRLDEGGVFRSTNAGSSWDNIGNPDVGEQGRFHFSIAADPLVDDMVYIRGQDDGVRIHVENTGGLAPNQPKTKQLQGGAGGLAGPNGQPHSDSRDMAFDGAGDLLDVNDGGIYRVNLDRDGADNFTTAKWTSINGNLQVSEIHHVAYDGTNDVIMAGFQDNGMAWQKSSGGDEWRIQRSGDGGDVAAGPVGNESVRIGSSQNLGIGPQLFKRGGNLRAFTFDSSNSSTGGHRVNAKTLWEQDTETGDAQFYTPIELNAVEEGKLAVGGESTVYMASNTHQGGNVNTQLTTDGIGANRPHGIEYGGFSAGNRFPDILYVGDGDEVYVGQARFGNRLGSGDDTNFPGDNVNDIALDPDDYTTAYVVTSGSVYRTDNSGSDWNEVTGNLGALSDISTDFHAVEYVPGKGGSPDRIFVAGNGGVYQTTAGSKQANRGWFEFGTDLPNAPVWDLEYASDTLVAGTLGRGAWKASRADFSKVPPLEGTLELNPFGDTELTSESLGTADPQDLVRFIVENNNALGTTTISVTNSTGSLNPGIRAWDLRDNAVLATNDSVSGAPDSELTLTLPHEPIRLPQHTFYGAEVFGEALPESGSENYDLEIDTPNPNLTTIPLDPVGDGSHADSLSARDTDYFEVTSPRTASGTLDVALNTAGSGSNLNGVLTLYNSSGDQIARANNTGPGSAEIVSFSNVQQEETYYLRVGSENYASTGSYSLDVDFRTLVPTEFTPQSFPSGVEGFAYFNNDATSPDALDVEAEIAARTERDSYYFAGDNGWNTTYTLTADDLGSGRVEPVIAVYDTATGDLLNHDSFATGTDSAQVRLHGLDAQKRYTAVVGHNPEVPFGGTTDVDLDIGAVASTAPSTISLDDRGFGSAQDELVVPEDSEFYSFTVPDNSTGTGTVRVTPVPPPTPDEPDLEPQLRLSNFDPGVALFGPTEAGNFRMLHHADSAGKGEAETINIDPANPLRTGQTYYATVLGEDYDSAGDYVADVNLDMSTATVSGMKIKDKDFDGTRDPGEPGLQDWVIYADESNNDTFERGGTVRPENLVARTGATRTTPDRLVPRGVRVDGFNPAGPSTFRVATRIHNPGGGGTPDKVFGWRQGGLEGTFWSGQNGRQFRARFEVPVSGVSIDGINPGGSPRIVRLEAYDDAGNLLDTTDVGISPGGRASAQVSTSGTDISSVRAYGTDPAGVLLDDLEYGQGASGEPARLTNASGQYALPGLLVKGGEPIRVREVQQNGWAQSHPGGDGEHEESLQPRPRPQRVTGRDFLDFRSGIITGTKFEDLDGDGTQDSGESGLQGRAIYVDLNDNEALDPGEPSDVTDSSGSYTISGVPAGTHRVRETSQSNYVPTVPRGAVQTVNVPANTTVSGIDFGNAEPSTISGTKFQDIDRDGTQDSGEPGLGSRTIYVDLNGNGRIDGGEPRDSTASDGSYQVSGVPPGTHDVREAAPPGWSTNSPGGGAHTVSVSAGSSNTGYNFGNVKQLDFGDAPDPDYPTLRSSNGARHLITGAGPVLGTAPDQEPDGQPGAGADNDELTGRYDEDGVTVPQAFVTGGSGAVDVTVGRTSGVLNAWVDFDGDGNWGTGPEHVIDNRSLSTGTSRLSIPVPSGAEVGQTYMRFRIAKEAGPASAPTGPAPDGEVEDYGVQIRETVPNQSFDYGDAPRSYGTLASADGPVHSPVDGFYLGSGVTAERDGQPSPRATGDDPGIPAPDEDGVVFKSAIVPGGTVNVDVTASTGTGKIDAFADFNNDGDFADSGEEIFDAVQLSSGTNSLSFSVPSSYSRADGPLFTRWRLGDENEGDLGPTGVLPNGDTPTGEVEDHVAPGFIIDGSALSRMVTNLQTPGGQTIEVGLAGSSELQTYVSGDGSAADTDGSNGDGLDEVHTEMVELDLEGSAENGPVSIELNDSFRSGGVLEETENTQDGRLDVPPFSELGSGVSSFEVFFNVELPDGSVVHNEAPVVMQGQVSGVEPGRGERLRSLESVPLLTSEGTDSGYELGPMSFVPEPELVDTNIIDGIFEVLGRDGAEDILLERTPAGYLQVAGGPTTAIDGGTGRFDLGRFSQVVVEGGPGSDHVLLSGDWQGASVEVRGGAGTDQLDAGGVGAGGVTLAGGPGNDILTGSPGNDTLISMAGQDDLGGGAGTDSLRTAGSQVDLNVETFSRDGAVSQMTGIETARVEGTSGADNMDASDFGGRANLRGLEGPDILVGSPQNDRLSDGPGDDTLSGLGGGDIFELRPGSLDVITDSDGNDRLDFSSADAPVNVDLDATGDEQVINSDGDQLRLEDRIEGFFGTRFSDTVRLAPLEVQRRIRGGGEADEGSGDVLDVDTLGRRAQDTGSAVEVAGFSPILYGDVETLAVPGSISGVAFEDVDGNAAYAPDTDRPMPGVSVTVTGTTDGGDEVSRTVETMQDDPDTPANEAGQYAFNDLPSGDYTVEQAVPDGYVSTVPGEDSVHEVELEAAEHVDDANFGNVAPGSVHGLVFSDFDGNGAYDPAVDALAPGVDVGLVGTDGTGESVELTATTLEDDPDTDVNEAGWFGFRDVRPGSYTLSEQLPTGMETTTGAGGEFTLRSGEELVALAGQAGLASGAPQEEVLLGNDLMFGNVAFTSIHGFAFEDVDADGAYEPGEDRRDPVITMELSRSGEVIGSAVTMEDDPDTAPNEAGWFSFRNLEPGSYTVREVVPEGNQASTATFRDVELTSGQEFVAVEGQAGLLPSSPKTEDVRGSELMFGTYEPGSIRGLKFNDMDGDGRRDEGAPALSGVDIQLTWTDDSGTEQTRTVATDELGGYSFGGLRPGHTYEVSEAGMFDEAARTTPVPEAVPLRSGEDYVATGTQRDALVSAGEPAEDIIVESTLSVGNRAATIRGQKWLDLNGDGERLSVNLVRQSNEFFQDEFGGSEKWLRGADGGWYFIEPDGTLTEWDETPRELSGEVVAELSSTMYEQPSRLLEAPREPAENGWEIELLNSDGQVIDTATTQDRDLDGDGRIDPATERGVYSFTGVPPGDYAIRELGKAGWTRSDPAGGGTHSVSIGVERLKAAELGLHRDSGTFYRDAFDGSEKWLRGEGDEWYYMTSDGTLTRWDAEPGRLGGDVVASLDSSFYENPSRLTELDKVREGFDFGNFQTSSVSGVAFRDVNMNGIFEAGTDQRLSGVTITLTGTDGQGNTVQRTMDTRTDDTATPENEAGTYSFAGLNPGRYSVEQESVGDLTQFVPPGDGSHAVSLRSGEQVTRTNFGNASLTALEGTILGRAFEDADGDGELDSGEGGLAGVTITLSGTDDAGNPVQRTTQVLSDDPGTAADEAGIYSFTDVPGGQYTLEEAVPQGYEATGPSDGTRSVTLASGDWRAGLHFGNARGGSIEGLAYRDVDDSGTFDPSVDERLAGVSVTLRGTNGAGERVTRTVQTLEDDPQTAPNEAGTYAFPGLLPGDYSVDEAVPQDLELTRPPEGDGYVASLESGENLAGRDFAHVQAEPPAASIEGQTWEDLKGDGARLGADLEQQGDTFFENAFGGGEKWLRGRRGGWFFVEPDGTVTEWDGTPGVLAGEVAAQLDPAVHDEPGRLIDMPREQLLASLPVELRNDDGNLLATVGTGPIDRNADGEIDPRTEAGQYSLDALAPGRYTVRQGDAVAWEQTYPSGPQKHEVVIDADRLKVSELDLREPSGSFLHDRYGAGEKWLRGGGGGWFYIRPDGTLTRWDAEPGSLSGDQVATLEGRFHENPGALTELDTVQEGVDFGNVKWAVVDGRVFRDVDGNGSYDQEIDEGTAGVTVRLTGTNLFGESVEQTVTTSTDVEGSELQDETGVYSFPELLPGTYTINQVVPEGRVQTTPEEDFTVTVGSGGEAENRNFGNVLAGSVHGLSFEDADADGRYEPETETGRPGVTVTLTGTSGAGESVERTTVTRQDNPGTEVDESGWFSFDDVAPGEYTVHQQVPEKADATTPTSSEVTVPSGTELVALEGQAGLEGDDPRQEEELGSELMFGSADTLIDSRTVEVGPNGPVTVSFYDSNAENGLLPEELIAWTPAGYEPGTTGAVVNAGGAGDGVVNAISLHDAEHSLRDLGAVVEGNTRFGRLVDRRDEDKGFSFLASQGHVSGVYLRSSFGAADLEGFTGEGGWELPAEIGSSEEEALYSAGRTGVVTATGDIRGDVVAAALGRVTARSATGEHAAGSGDIDGQVAGTEGKVSRVTVVGTEDDEAELRGGVAAEGPIGRVLVLNGTIGGDIDAAGNIGNVTTIRGRGVQADVTAGGTIGRVQSIRGSIDGQLIRSGGNIGLVRAIGGNVRSDVGAPHGDIGRVVARALPGDGSGHGGTVAGDISAGTAPQILAVGGGVEASVEAESRRIGEVRAIGGDVSGHVRATGPVGTVVAVGGDVTGDVESTGGVIGRVVARATRGDSGDWTGGRVEGRVSASTRVGTVAGVRGGIKSTISADTGYVARVVAVQGDVAGSVTAGGPIYNVTSAGGDMLADLRTTGGSESGIHRVVARNLSTGGTVRGSIQASGPIGSVAAIGGDLDLRSSHITAGSSIRSLQAIGGHIRGDGDNATKEVTVSGGNVSRMRAIRGDIDGVAVDVKASQHGRTGRIGRVEALGSPTGITDSLLEADTKIGLIRSTGRSGHGGGHLRGTTAESGRLGHVLVDGQIEEGAEEEEEIHALEGRFFVRDEDEGGFVPPERTLGGVRVYVG